MLPGERPVTVWRPEEDTRKPPWYRFNRRVALSYVPPLVAVALAILLVTLYLVTRTPVVLVVDGEVTLVQTHARTVQGALAARRIRLAEGDVVRPEPGTRLEADTVVSVQRAREVRVSVDGAAIIVSTREADPLAILDEAGVTLGPSDAVLVERVVGPTPQEVKHYPVLAWEPSLPSQLRVVRATPITIDDDGERFTLRTTAPTVGEALLALETPLYEGDVIAPSYSTPISPDMQVTIRRATYVALAVDGKQIGTRTHETSVGGVLAELDIGLSGDDYAIPATDTPLIPGMQVRVVRAGEEVLVEEEPIPYETVWQPEPNFELDQAVVLREGEDGVLQREVRVRYEDGVEVSRVVRGEWVAREPINQIMGYGTQIVIRTLDTELGPLDYWRRMRVLATSYTAATSGKEPGSPGYGVTGTGLPMRHGIVAVDPRTINFFTEMYVPGYGLGLVADAGGAIKGMRIDLGYDEDNLVLWYEWVDVYLLTPVPDPDEIIWVLPEQR
jgi:uncharacterized protein YabE (DUF348 family)